VRPTEKRPGAVGVATTKKDGFDERQIRPRLPLRGAAAQARPPGQPRTDGALPQESSPLAAFDWSKAARPGKLSTGEFSCRGGTRGAEAPPRSLAGVGWVPAPTNPVRREPFFPSPFIPNALPTTSRMKSAVLR